MIFSSKYKYIFIHIPKTGGTSIENQLLAVEKMHHRTTFGYSMDYPFKKHINVRTLKQLISPAFFNVLYKWAVVRNPFDRCISQYYFQKALWPKLSESLEEFVAKAEVISQLDYVQLQGKVVCDIYRFEDGLDNIIKAASTKINAHNQPNPYKKEFPIIDKLDHHIYGNTRPKGLHYRDAINPTLRKIIEEKHKKDFEYFNYDW